jgi:hypothetical protein
MYFTGGPPTTSFETAGIHPPLEEGIWNNVSEALVPTFVLFNQTVAIRAKALKRVGGFNESMRFMEDYDLALRLSLEGSSWAYIREPMVIWRQGSPGSLFEEASINDRRVNESALKTYAAAMEQVGHNPRMLQLLRRESNRCRRELSLIATERRNLLRGPIMTKILRKVEQYRSAIYRRSPSYPRPRFESLKGME